jgi:hypothetical protein
MSNAYHKAVGNRGMLDRLIAKLPGYRGYIDRDARQEADRLQREFVANRLFGEKSTVSEAMDALMMGGDLSRLPDLERVNKRLDTVAQKIRAASYGSASLFGASSIGEEELRRLHEFDIGLVDAADEVKAELGELVKAVEETDKLNAKLRDVRALLDRVEEHFKRRADIIARGTA